MEREAIGLIQQTAIDAHANRIPDPLYGKIIALPNDYTLHDLEQFQAHRRAFRGRFVTPSIPAFAEYVSKQTGGNCFIDSDDMRASAFFDLGTLELPGHARHMAHVKLEKTSAYSMLLGTNGHRFAQRDLVDWIEDWSPNLSAYGATPDEPKTMTEAITAVRQVTIKTTKESENTEKDFQTTRSTLEDIEARSRVGLPGGFLFTCEPYLGLHKRTFRIRLGVLTSGDKPILTLRIVQLEAVQEEMADEFKRVLSEAVGDSANIIIGEFMP